MKRIMVRRGRLLQSLDEVRARRRLRADPPLWRALRPIVQASASTGCTSYELDVLYRNVVERRPRRVLELGAGISTIVLGYAARKVAALGGQPPTIVSMEESAFYHEDLSRLIPDEVRGHIRLVLSPVEDRECGDGLIGRRYASTPAEPYDLVFIDGPQVPMYRDDRRYFDADILDVLDWNEGPFTALLDNRKGTRINLATLLPWAWMEHDPRHRLTRIAIPEAAARR